MPNFVVNGKSYASLDEMPPDVRQSYEQAMAIWADKNQNAIPDALEGMLGTGNVNMQTTPINMSTMLINVDGKQYSSIDDVPPEARQRYEQAMAKLGQVMGDANHDGMPDMFEAAMPDQARSVQATAISDASPQLSAMPQQATTSAASDVILRYRLVIGLLVIALLGLAAFVIFSLLR